MLTTNLFKRNLINSKMACRAFSSRDSPNADPYNNIPKNIWDLTQRKIYKIPNHPIRILIDEVERFFKEEKISDIEIPGEKF